MGRLRRNEKVMVGAIVALVAYALIVGLWVALRAMLYVGAAFAAWAVVAVGLRLLASRRARRAGGRVCARCGYDLRASRGRCPECGALTPPW
ncbi:MAG TPA: hypothetical protein VEA69_06725 [Tepidisphaeraceae bacterium]|nr:hypothetical protein [Tepidisphaeraceae bacterium]